MQQVQLDNYDYFLIYCIEENQYNTAPKDSGIYNIVFLGYNKSASLLAIGEYKI
jgi:hypothetical protein